MTQPEWATPIIRDVLYLHNRTKPPRILWKHGRGSGVAYRKGRKVNWNGLSFRIKRRRGSHEITLRIDGDLTGSKLVLLHELSHWLLRDGHGHDKTFWRKAWELYYIFLTPEELEAIKQREFNYKG